MTIIDDRVAEAAAELLTGFDFMWEWMVENETERTLRPGWVALSNACCNLREALDTRLSDPLAQLEGKRRNDHPDTSRKAAFEVMPRSGTQRWVVLDAIAKSVNGMTDEEIQISLGMNPNTERPRRVELVEGKWVKDSGSVRPTREGKDAIVWVLTQNARLKAVV